MCVWSKSAEFICGHPLPGPGDEERVRRVRATFCTPALARGVPCEQVSRAIVVKVPLPCLDCHSEYTDVICDLGNDLFNEIQGALTANRLAYLSLASEGVNILSTIARVFQTETGFIEVADTMANQLSNVVEFRKEALQEWNDAYPFGECTNDEYSSDDGEDGKDGNLPLIIAEASTSRELTPRAFTPEPLTVYRLQVPHIPRPIPLIDNNHSIFQPPPGLTLAEELEGDWLDVNLDDLVSVPLWSPVIEQFPTLDVAAAEPSDVTFEDNTGNATTTPDLPTFALTAPSDAGTASNTLPPHSVAMGLLTIPIVSYGFTEQLPDESSDGFTDELTDEEQSAFSDFDSEQQYSFSDPDSESNYDDDDVSDYGSPTEEFHPSSTEYDDIVFPDHDLDKPRARVGSVAAFKATFMLSTIYEHPDEDLVPEPSEQAHEGETADISDDEASDTDSISSCSVASLGVPPLLAETTRMIRAIMAGDAPADAVQDPRIHTWSFPNRLILELMDTDRATDALPRLQDHRVQTQGFTASQLASLGDSAIMPMQDHRVRTRGFPTELLESVCDPAVSMPPEAMKITPGPSSMDMPDSFLLTWAR